MTLTEVLQDDARLRAVCRDGAALVDSEVARKSGIRATALKAGYKTFKKLKPGIVEEAIGVLLPAFAPAIDPHYTKAVESGDVKAYFTRHSDAIAEALLGVTDDKAKRAKNRVMVKVYTSLRGQAHKHTAEAVPALADLIEKHVPA